MTVRRDRNERWRYRVVVKLPDGSTKRISGTPTVNTKRDAERAERDHIQRTLNPVPTREVMTFREFIEVHWWPTYPKAAGNRHSTIREKEQHLRLYLLPHLGRRLLEEVKGRAVERMFADLADKGLAPKTRKNVRATLRKALVSAHEWGLLEAVPALPRIKVPEPSFDFLTVEESEALLRGARGENARTLLLFALRAGARAGELLAARWGDVDWHGQKMAFRRSRTAGHEGPTKSGRARHVPLTPELAAALKRHRHLKGERIFCGPQGEPLTLWQLHNALETACRRAGLRQIRFHDLRHTFASQLVQAGVPLRQVQEWLGHSTITMTMRYAHLAPDAGAHLIGVLDGARPALAPAASRP